MKRNGNAAWKCVCREVLFGFHGVEGCVKEWLVLGMIVKFGGTVKWKKKIYTVR